jgi:hypothetical protein
MIAHVGRSEDIAEQAESDSVGVSSGQRILFYHC